MAQTASTPCEPQELRAVVVSSPVRANQWHFWEPPEYRAQNAASQPASKDSYAEVFSIKSSRKSFLRKMHAILTCQLLITIGCIALFLYIPSIKAWTMKTSQVILVVVAAVAFIAIAIPLAFDSLLRRAPANFIYLVILTLTESFLLGYISGGFDTRAILMVMVSLAALCFTLTVFGGECVCCVFISLIVIPLMSYGNWLFLLHQDQNQIPALVAASIVSFILGCFFANNLSKMVRKNEHSLLPHEHVFAVLNIMRDMIILIFIALFWLAINAVLSLICLRVMPKCEDPESEA